MTSVILLAFAIFAIAVLYSAVGHAGASGYLAAMAIVSELPQDEMKAVALTLNIFVGAIGSYRFVRAGHFHWSTFWPFGISAVPMAFLGGLWELPPIVFKPLIGAVLLFAALVMLVRAFRPREQSAEQRVAHMPPLSIALIAGAALGLMAGLTGTGGGIFLSPLLIVAGWADPKRTAGVSVVFVLVNSIAGLGGVIAESPALPTELPLYLAAAVAGGLLGSGLGARRLGGNSIRALLAVVLIIAAIKMFATATGQAIG
ncbi:MAG: sulfite exporter TauE/SafE family protein [Planctomycetota bacterium]|nr:MAG: sulfite exporter TauE/SafE family protein [Planctomycetota bacterium]